MVQVNREAINIFSRLKEEINADNPEQGANIQVKYFRMKGDKVVYVSGSDCNGTPIVIKAKQEGVPTKGIADRYHEEFKECFQKLGFTYDCYTRTETDHHHEVVQSIFLELLEIIKIYMKKDEQCFCPTCNQFSPDRFVEGICPHCWRQARGDQCDHCSNILDLLELLDRTCKVCGDAPVAQETEYCYFELSSFQKELEEYLKQTKANHLWRENAIELTKR